MINNKCNIDKCVAGTSKKLSPPKKRPKKGHLGIHEKNMVLNVYKHELQESPERLISEIVQQVADKTGICRASVFNIIREYRTTGRFSAPKTNQNRNNSISAVDDFDRNAIRRKIHEFFFRNELPTIDKVLNIVNADPDLPNFKRSTFHKFLKTLNFKHERRGRNSVLLDKEEIVLWRRTYLKDIKRYRNENRQIYYLDETWINAGHTKSKIWVDKTVTSSR